MGYFRPLSQTKFINDANLVRYYPFDGNSTDAKSGNNGTDTSISYSSSYAVNSNFVQGVNFTGSGSHIIANNTSLPTGASAFTTVFWFKTSTAGTQAFYGYGTAAANGYRNSVMIVSNKFYFSGFGADLDSAVTVNDGVIHQGVVTYSGTTMKIFVDGVKKNSGAVTLNVQSGTSFYLGENSQTDTFYTGDMDDFAMFSRELTEGEVAELYQSQTLGEYLGAGSATTKLLMHLNGSSADSSGNNNNGSDTSITYSQANGKFGQGAGFGGTSSKINFGNILGSTFTSAFTVNAWIYPTNVAQLFGLLTKTNSNQPGPLDIKIYDNVSFGLGNGSSNNFVATASSVITVNTWQLVTLVYTGGTSTASMYIYVNGLDRTNTRDSNTWVLSDTANNLMLGQRNDNADNTLGAIDEVIVENVAWSAEKVKKYYTNSRGRYATL